ncbi:MAG: fibronectin type III domain-containing protein [Candidatus Peregrinibacteria bacterium]|nr:fibronectin type III domain-containing protein [Candidatus Peregrinibacteria bacterium]
MKIKTILISLLVIAAGVVSTAVSASSVQDYTVVPVQAYGMDAVAGTPTILRTSKLNVGSVATFTVVQPGGKQLQFQGIADDSGIAYSKLSDYYTSVAGTYTLLLSVDGGSQQAIPSYFKINAGQLSMSNSELSPKDQVVHTGSEVANLTVKLRDNFNNPISGHIVKLVSSSDSDSISYLGNTNISNVNGEVNFRIIPSSTGLVNYSVYDVTSDVILTSRAKIVYFSSADQLFTSNKVRMAAFGSSNEGNASGAVDHFEFQEVPANVTANQSVSIKLSAYDAASQLVSNYSGKVRFSVDGSNAGFATLPDDYTFGVSDQGSRVFSLAFNFKQPGVYNLKVTDLANVGAYGTKSITVSAGDNSGANPVSSSTVVLISPLPGTFSTNVQVVSGTAPASAKLKIFDNNVEMSSIVADSSGKFSYTTSLLADGIHKMYVAVVNDIGTVVSNSPAVEFSILTKGSKVSQIVVDPAGPVDPGTSINVKAYTGDTLSKAQVVVSGNVYTLEKNPAGYYEGKFNAPIDFGTYKLSFSFVSDLGVETKSDDKSIQVGKLGAVQISKPEKVLGLVAKPADSRVILNWSAPASLLNPVKNYRIYYGTSPNSLVNAVDTFTNATTWYIPGLKNGTEYYFAVAAVDAKGNISDGFDKIANAVVGGVVNVVQPPAVQNGSAGKAEIKNLKGGTSKTGPEMFWLVILSVMGGACYNFVSKKKCR